MLFRSVSQSRYDGGGGGAVTITGSDAQTGNGIKQGNLYANLTGDLTAKGAEATINKLRQAISVQQYYEALARGGSRYREQTQALWNVTISDKTVQVPEYLGGGRYHVNINSISTKLCRQRKTISHRWAKLVRCQ